MSVAAPKRFLQDAGAGIPPENVLGMLYRQVLEKSLGRDPRPSLESTLHVSRAHTRRNGEVLERGLFDGAGRQERYSFGNSIIVVNRQLFFRGAGHIGNILLRYARPPPESCYWALTWGSIT